MEVRKTHPKIKTPFRCYIYCMKRGKYKDRNFVKSIWLNRGIGNGKVIGEFICDYIIEDTRGEFAVEFEDEGCIPIEKQRKYSPKGILYGWHISDLKIYDKPRELSEFFTANKEAIRQCENREQSYYAFTDTGYIKNGFYCKKKDDWCFGGCKRKVLTRPPHSWMYVEELQE